MRSADLPFLLTLVAVALLVVRFFSATALAAVTLPHDAQIAIGNALAAYEGLLGVLGLAFLAVILVLHGEGARRWEVTFVIAILAAAVSVGFLLPRSPAFIAASVASLSLTGVVSWRFWHRTRPGPPWGGAMLLALVVIVPVAFAMRALATTGLVSGVGFGGWLFVNAPTLMVELLVLAVWVNMFLDHTALSRTRPIRVLGPFAIVPALLFVHVVAGGFVGFVFSFLLLWGGGLALFVPGEVSLAVLMIVFAAFISIVAMQPRGRRRRFLTAASMLAVIAGYSLTPASVAGLALGLVTIPIALLTDRDGRGLAAAA